MFGEKRDINISQRIQIQILNIETNEYCTYLEYNPHKNFSEKLLCRNGNLSLLGNYFGSSTRISEIGTFYFEETNEYIELSIRILIDDEIRYDFILTKQIINEMINNLSVSGYTLNNGVKIYHRNLHRFLNYPYEISGISFPFDC